MSTSLCLESRGGTTRTSALLLLASQLAGCGLVVGWPVECEDCDSGTAPDSAPQVRDTVPADAATDVAPNGAIVVIFDSWMDTRTLTDTTVTLSGPSGAVSATVEHSADSAFLYPSVTLEPDTAYQGTVTTGVKNAQGLAMKAEYRWTFETGAESESTVPYVTSTTPDDQETDVDPTRSLTATFSEAMKASTIDETTFLLLGPDGAEVSGVVSHDSTNDRSTFAPDAELLPGAVYSARVEGVVQDLAGNEMSGDYVWVFMTAGIDWPLDPVDLGSLDSFVAVAGAGLSNSNSNGTTTLNGDVGLSPLALCMGDGVPCTMTNPVINGFYYANDAEGVAAQAKADLVLAYADAMSRPPGTVVQDLSEMTLAPGVYTSDSSMQLGVGSTLVLDGEGDPNAVWIFQIGSSLTVDDDSQVLLINGARAENVYWAVFASATLGAEVNFQGSVLAGASNSMGPGSTVVGRLLCSTGEITLLSNAVTLPPL